MSERVCNKHPDRRAVGECAICRKLICSECRAEFGYFCSAACKPVIEPRVEEQHEPWDVYGTKEIDGAMRQVGRFFKYVLAPLVVLLAIVGSIYSVTDDRGERLWEVNAPQDLPWSDPVLSRRYVLLACADGAVHALHKASGETAWRTEVGTRRLAEADPVLLGWDRVLVRDREKLYGVDVSSSELVWTFVIDGRLRAGPVAAGTDLFLVRDLLRELTSEEKLLILRGKKASDLNLNLVYVRDDDQPRVHLETSVIALSGKTGKQEWTRPLDDVWIHDGFAYSDKLVYTTEFVRIEEDVKPPDPDKDPETKTSFGEKVKSGLKKAGEKIKGAGRKIAEAVKGRKGGDEEDTGGGRTRANHKRMLIACKASSGKVYWKRELTGKAAPTLLAIEDGVLLVYPDRFVAVSSSKGRTLWEHKRTDNDFSPRVMDEILLVEQGESGLSCLRLDDGTKRWSVRIPGYAGDVTPGKGMLFVGGALPRKGGGTVKDPDAPSLFAVSRKTGKILWQAHNVGTESVVRGGRIITWRTGRGLAQLTSGNRTAQISCLDAATGAAIWKHDYPGALRGGAMDERRFYFSAYERDAGSAGMGAFTSHDTASALSLHR